MNHFRNVAPVHSYIGAIYQTEHRLPITFCIGIEEKPGSVLDGRCLAPGRGRKQEASECKEE
jgi:hypothetical protein